MSKGGANFRASNRINDLRGRGFEGAQQGQRALSPAGDEPARRGLQAFEIKQEIRVVVERQPQRVASRLQRYFMLLLKIAASIPWRCRSL